MKQFIHFKKAKLLLTALIALFAGGMSPAWADTLTENFDEVTRLDANGNEVTGSILMAIHYPTDGSYLLQVLVLVHQTVITME